MNTLEDHIQQSSGNAALALLKPLSDASKQIRHALIYAGLNGLYGQTGDTNVQGESVQKLDDWAHQTMVSMLANHPLVSTLASEEAANAIQTPLNGPYTVLFDPLDGSSNIDVNISVGTIFSILLSKGSDAMANCLQPGHQQCLAGYVLYGPATTLIYTAGHGVYGFILDPEKDIFIQTETPIRLPDQTPYYSMNDALLDQCEPSLAARIHALKTGKSSRYVGALVADFHRHLYKGGVYLYPATPSHPSGKLRLLYEANPLAWIAEQAGGWAHNGQTPILSVLPTHLHQRVPLFIGNGPDRLSIND